MIQVAVGILMNDGNVLLCQRKSTSRYPLKWEFPGGKTEDGESAEDCLRRELYEELGITAEIGELFYRQQYVYSAKKTVDDSTRRADKPDSGSFDVCYYVIPSFDGTIVNNVFATYKWVPLPKLHSFDILEGNNEVIQKLLRVHGNVTSNAH